MPHWWAHNGARACIAGTNDKKRRNAPPEGGHTEKKGRQMDTLDLAAGFGRRGLLRGAAAGALAGTMALPRVSRAAEGITFGSITPSTGTYGFAGKLVTNGAQLAIDMAGGKVLGQPIRYISRDDEGRSATGVRRLSEAISNDGLVVFNGNYASDIGLAESAIARREKVLQYAAGGSEDFTGARCSRYTFQWSANPYTAMKTVMDYVAKTHPGAKRWYTVTADYVFGQALLKYAKVVGEDKGMTFVGNSAHPLGERQYTQYLTQAVAAKPDVICLLSAGTDAVTCLRQLAGFGVKDVVVVAPWAIEIDQLPEVPEEMRGGLILGENYFYTIDTPVNREFVDAYRKKYGSLPGYAAAYGYDSFRTVLLAMEKAKTVEIPKVIETMEGMHYDGLLGPSSIDAATHQTVRPYFVVQGKARAAMKAPDDYADVVATGSDPQPKALNACKEIGAL
jgi:branched-chain amino acid transport system substrate-binding protein